MSAREIERYQEAMRKLLDKLSPEEWMAGLTPEERMAGLTPEERMAGLTPEERMAGLAPEQVLLTLPDAVLRWFSEEYIATLPEPARTTIRARRGR